jgi:hypothetical protein
MLSHRKDVNRQLGSEVVKLGARSPRPVAVKSRCKGGLRGIWRRPRALVPLLPALPVPNFWLRVRLGLVVLMAEGNSERTKFLGLFRRLSLTEPPAKCNVMHVLGVGPPRRQSHELKLGDQHPNAQNV